MMIVSICLNAAFVWTDSCAFVRLVFLPKASNGEIMGVFVFEGERKAKTDLKQRPPALRRGPMKIPRCSHWFQGPRQIRGKLRPSRSRINDQFPWHSAAVPR
jgi:hypothetical protein